MGLRLGTRQAQVAQTQSQLFFHGGKNNLFVGVLKHHAHDGGCTVNFWGRQMYLPCLWLVQPADQPKQAAFTSAVVADEADAGLTQFQCQRLKHGGVTTQQCHPIERDVRVG